MVQERQRRGDPRLQTDGADGLRRESGRQVPLQPDTSGERRRYRESVRLLQLSVGVGVPRRSRVQRLAG